MKKPSMASAREFKEKRAEAAAKLAVSDLKEINRERGYEERAKIEREESQQQEERPGVIESVLKAVHEMYEHAKEAVVRKGEETAETTRERVENAIIQLRSRGRRLRGLGRR